MQEAAAARQRGLFQPSLFRPACVQHEDPVSAVLLAGAFAPSCKIDFPVQDGSRRICQGDGEGRERMRGDSSLREVQQVNVFPVPFFAAAADAQQAFPDAGGGAVCIRRGQCAGLFPFVFPRRERKDTVRPRFGSPFKHGLFREIGTSCTNHYFSAGPCVHAGEAFRIGKGG